MTTEIEWVKNSDGTKGKTWNPVTGCTPVSAGCTHCYAKRMARRLAGRHGYPEAPHHFDVVLRPERLEQPLHWRKPKTIFVCSMSDLFHEDVPPSFICKIWQVMRECPQHTFQILTKRARRMFEIITTYIANDALGFAPLPNVWGLVTTENQATADERIPWLLNTPFAVRGVSVEPMLREVDLMPYLPLMPTAKWHLAHSEAMDWLEDRGYLDWVICGGESGPGARPMHPDWARSLRDQCQGAGTPYFFKQHGAWLHGSQFPLASPWAELQHDGARVHGRPINWYYEPDRTYHWPDGSTSYRIGKKRAGHLFDGREHHGFPRTSVDTAPDDP